jgi:ectoine hydroxylase-related dioxygenase (phytanoyl-CoA dioxygenase family)
MPFLFSDQHIDEYHTQGYTLFRSILSPSLIADLRRVTDRAREIAREKHGPQAQRLQPVFAYDLDPQPFEEFGELPPLRDAISRVLSPRHTFGTRALLGVLIEPAERPWCTKWHRDWRDNAPGLDVAAWEAVFHDVNYFNQLNCAVYQDSSTWVVPGSHLRDDLPREQAAFPTGSIPAALLEEGTPNEERERACLEYCRRMPGAVCLHLDAGDFALYRNTLWHLGNYVPYSKRATLHDVVDTPEFIAWRQRVRSA